MVDGWVLVSPLSWFWLVEGYKVGGLFGLWSLVLGLVLVLVG